MPTLSNSKCKSQTLKLAATRNPHAQGHVLQFAEFCDSMLHAFGTKLHPDVVRATFDLLDTQPRTWLLDFDEFCAWLDTGVRKLHNNGCPVLPEALQDGSTGTEKRRAAAAKAGAPRRERRLSSEQLDRQKLKAHLLKHEK